MWGSAPHPTKSEAESKTESGARFAGTVGLGPLAFMLLHRLALIRVGILPTQYPRPTVPQTRAQNNPNNFARIADS